jgi:ABC-2 type transport system ATP-binding protein
MITAEGLTKIFGGFTAIEDVSFQVARGEIVGFLGPNGAGKTTTMRILAGVFPPTRGRAVIAGYDVVKESLHARSVVGYFPERVSLYTDMTVEHYLRYVAEMKGVERAAMRRDVAHALEACDLVVVAERVIGTLSKGFRQRVGIAQALVGSPRVLILDEPTAGLDPEQVAEMRTLIRGLRGQRTVILSTHILPEIESTCDRVIIINRGKVLAVDTPTNLNRRLRATSQIYLEVNTRGTSVVDSLSALPGVVSVKTHDSLTADGIVALTVATEQDSDLRETIASTVARCGGALRELRPVSLSLEEIFLSLIGAPRSTTGQTKERHEVPRDLSA